MRTPEPNPLASRTNLQNAFLSLEAPLLATWKPDSAGPDLGPWRAWYGLQASHLEVVARYLWGLVPFTAGGGKSKGWPTVLDAIVHGTDPQHPQYWGQAGNSDQRSVEMAAFGLALRLVPDQIWNPLSREQKDRLATWLGGMVGQGLVATNWQFFRLMVTMGLRHIDRAPANADDMDQKAITLIDSFYVKNGWYSDGAGGQRDYYIPMAFHFYGTHLAQLAEAGPVTARANDWRARAKEFANDFVHWFSADGAAFALGRSLTYRFAQGAFWAGAALAGVDTFSPGELKGMLLRHFRWWWQQPILNVDGTLSLGYAYPNLNMLEPYNAFGSPYWAFKAFSALQLPETHPFWAEKEKPIPDRPTPSAQPEPCFLIDRDPDTGHVVALSAGQWHPGWALRHRDAKYAKLAYSTYFGTTVGPNHEWLGGTGIDSTLSIMAGATVRTDGTLWQNRGLTTNQTVAKDHVVSDWSSVEGVKVRSWLAHAGPGWHVRVHCIQTDKPLQFAEGGFASEDPQILSRIAAGVCARGVNEEITGIIDVTGGRTADLNDVEPNSSLFHSRVKTVVLSASLPAGTHWFAAAVFGAPPGSKGAWEQPPKTELIAGKSLTVSWASRSVNIRLDAGPTTQP